MKFYYNESRILETRKIVLLNSEVPGLHEVKELLEDDDASCLAEEEDGVGCPLPSTPEDDHLLDCEVL